MNYIEGNNANYLYGPRHFGVFAFSTLTAAAQSDGIRRYAVVVGVNDYEHPKLAKFRYAENDAAELGSVLEKAGYQVTLLTSEIAKKKPAQAPTAKNIRDRLQAVTQECRKGDLVLVAFSGHGLRFEGGKDSYFCPIDAIPRSDRANSLVSMSEVYSNLDKSHAGFKVLLADACNDDPASSARGAIDDNVPRPPQGVVALFSCKAGQRAFEHQKYNHGVFFHYVIEGLMGEAADKKGRVTFDRLASYVRSEVPEDVDRLVGGGARQTPAIMAEYADEPVLVPGLANRLNDDVARRRSPDPIPDETTPEVKALIARRKNPFEDSQDTSLKTPGSKQTTPGISSVPAAGRKYAVLVGVKDYDHSSLKPLKYTENDAAKLATELRALGYEVVLLTGAEGARNANLIPTGQNIRARLAEARQKTDRESTLLIGMAGHGVQFEGKEGAFFCPKDARPFPEDTSTLVSLTEVYRDLERSGAGVKLLVVDACRDDPTSSRGIDGDNAPKPPKGVSALFSCSAGERAYEHEKYQHGVFFYHFIQGLKGEAANTSGEVTWDALQTYVRGKVADDVPQLYPKNGATQEPNLIGNVSGKSPVLKPGKR